MSERGRENLSRATPLWLLLGLVIMVLLLALLLAYREVSAASGGLDVWTIRVLTIDYEKGEVTIRLDDLNEMVNSHNRQVNRIKGLEDAIRAMRKGQCA